MFFLENLNYNQSVIEVNSLSKVMSRMLLAKSPPKCLEYASENCKDAHLGDGFIDSDFDRIFLRITLEPIETFEKSSELLHTIFGYRQG